MNILQNIQKKSLEIEVRLRLKEIHIISSPIFLTLSGLTSLTIFNDCFTKRNKWEFFFQGLVSFVLLLTDNAGNTWPALCELQFCWQLIYIRSFMTFGSPTLFTADTACHYVAVTHDSRLLHVWNCYIVAAVATQVSWAIHTPPPRRHAKCSWKC